MLDDFENIKKVQVCKVEEYSVFVIQVILYTDIAIVRTSSKYNIIITP